MMTAHVNESETPSFRPDPVAMPASVRHFCRTNKSNNLIEDGWTAEGTTDAVSRGLAVVSSVDESFGRICPNLNQ